MNIDDIQAGWGEYVYVWVRPCDGKTWKEILGTTSGKLNSTDWRPAMINGFLEPDSHHSYNTLNDPRRVWIIGHAGAYSLTSFEVGDLIASPDQEITHTPEVVLPSAHKL